MGIDLDNIMLSEMSEKDKNCIITLIYGISKILQTDVYIKQKQTHRYRKQISGYQWGERKREGQNIGRGLNGTNNYI